jgi:hypothetical protein
MAPTPSARGNALVETSNPTTHIPASEAARPKAVADHDTL